MIYRGLESEADQRVLKARADELAKTTVKSSKADVMSFLVFCLGNHEKYAMSYQNIERICPQTSLTRLPGMSSFMCGVTYHNARVWPVIDLENLLNIPQVNGEDSKTQHYIFLEDGAYGYACLVKYVVGHMELDVSTITPRPGIKKATDDNILGVCQSDITMIDDKAVLEHIRHMSFART